MCHILAIVSIQNQTTAYEHRNMSYIMQKCPNCDISDMHIYAKNMYRAPKALASTWIA